MPLFSFWGDFSFLFLIITHSSHVTGLLTSLVFIITSFHCYVLPLFFVSQTYLFFSHNYSSLPHHQPADYTCLCNCFLPSTSLDFYDSFLLTCMYFFIIPSHSIKFLLLCCCYDSPLFFSFGPIFSFLVITHPSHVISPLTTLVFVIASFHLLPRTSLTHLRLLVCTSSRFHRIPLCSFGFVIIPELSKSQVYKPSTRYLLP